MKKVIALLTAALLVFGLTACGQKEAPETKAPTPETEAKTTQAAEDGTAQGTEAQTAEAGKTEEGVRTSLTVGFDAEFPPYGYMDDNGDYVGFDLDLAAEVCKRQGWELVKQPINWDTKDEQLSTGAIDCIWNGFTMKSFAPDLMASTTMPSCPIAVHITIFASGWFPRIAFNA